MEESYEKSCWSVTVWALALILGAVLLIAFFSGVDSNIVVSSIEPL